MCTSGKRLKILRNKVGITQKDFGVKLAMGWNKIKDMEIGRVKITPEIARLISCVFNTNENWLLTGKGNMEEKKPEKELKLDSVTDKILEKVSAMTEMQKKLILNFVEEKEFVWKSIEKEKEEKAAFKKKLKVN